MVKKNKKTPPPSVQVDLRRQSVWAGYERKKIIRQSRWYTTVTVAFPLALIVPLALLSADAAMYKPRSVCDVAGDDPDKGKH